MKYKVTLRGKVYEVEVERGEAILLDEYEAALPQAPAEAESLTVPAAASTVPTETAKPAAEVSGTQVHAPMPGNIIDVQVKTGEAVKEGQVLCILEAMKMENEILAPHAGTVEVLTAKGMVVDTGDLLFAVE